ncbi:MAG: hypothetical protein ACI9O4_000959 [Chitinophagales bacterium]|jgi:hypothetical protein
MVSMGVVLKAENPKMFLKARIGGGVTSFVYKDTEITRDYFATISGGFGFRVHHEKKMFEVDFDFVRSFISQSDSALQGDITLKLNSFQLPINVGFITINKPVFKHFIYAGIVTSFNIKSIIFFENEKVDVLKPKEIYLISPTFMLRMGTQFDIAMFNFDFHYSIGLNKTVKGNIRTQSHGLVLSAGLVF